MVFMKQVTRTLFRHRTWLKRLIPVRRPVRIHLSEMELYVRLDDWAVGARIAMKRSYEPHVVEAMRAHVRPGAVAIDIGANIGFFTMLLGKLVGPAGRVIAFEPGASNCSLIRMSARANRLENITLHQCAVADVDGVVGYGMDDSNGSITREDPLRAPLQVSAVTLDRALADEPRVDMIKIDIEGGEGRALRGMEETLRRHRPVVLSEFFPYGLDVTSGMAPEEYLSRLTALGYDLFLIPHKDAIRARPWTASEILARTSELVFHDHVDLIAIPRGASGTF